MKEQFLSQAKHNADFRDCINQNFTDKFFDWKITAVFYEAIHYLKALAAMRNIDLGASHMEINANVHPSRHGKMPIASNAFKGYSAMLGYSMSARYTGITDHETFNTLLENDYKDALVQLEFFKKYIHGQGCEIPGVILSDKKK